MALNATTSDTVAVVRLDMHRTRSSMHCTLRVACYAVAYADAWRVGHCVASAHMALQHIRVACMRLEVRVRPRSGADKWRGVAQVQGAGGVWAKHAVVAVGGCMTIASG